MIGTGAQQFVDQNADHDRAQRPVEVAIAVRLAVIMVAVALYFVRRNGGSHSWH